MMKNILLVGFGGALGSMARFAVQHYFNTIVFPAGTLAVNLVGCFAIGILWGMVAKNGNNEWLKLLLMTGFCGGFTTFSAFTLESLQLLSTNKLLMFFTYFTLSVLGGLLATFIGFKIAD